MSEPTMKKVKGDGVEINLAVWEARVSPSSVSMGLLLTVAAGMCWPGL